jgi:hypothetical protein
MNEIAESMPDDLQYDGKRHRHPALIASGEEIIE